MKSFLSITILFILLYGCSKSPLSVPVFDENVKIAMVEQVDSTKRTLTFNCATEKIFGCINFLINNRVTVSDNKISIHFIEIAKSDICLTAIGPATATIELGSLANKNYELELTVGEEKILGQLAVSATGYQASLPVQSRVGFTNPDLKRIPANTIYGKVHYHAAATSATVDKFLDSLQIVGAANATYLPGNYVSFDIEPTGQIKQTQDMGYYFTRYFIYNYTGQSARLRTLVGNYGRVYADSLLIELNTTRGETYYSWAP